MLSGLCGKDFDISSSRFGEITRIMGLVKKARLVYYYKPLTLYVSDYVKHSFEPEQLDFET